VRFGRLEIGAPIGRAVPKDAALKPVPMSQSATTMSKLMTPEDANVYGNVHGGAILKYIDEAAAVAAWRHARVPKVVTVSLERMDFKEPVYIGDILHVRATVRHVGRTSMLVGVRIEAENPTTGEVRHTASCYMTFVALDRNNQPTPVPPVVAETPDEKAKMEKAKRIADIIKGSRADPVDKL
jgi:acyl-CoA hydrolase